VVFTSCSRAYSNLTSFLEAKIIEAHQHDYCSSMKGLDIFLTRLVGVGVEKV